MKTGHNIASCRAKVINTLLKRTKWEIESTTGWNTPCSRAASASSFTLTWFDWLVKLECLFKHDFCYRLKSWALQGNATQQNCNAWCPPIQSKWAAFSLTTMWHQLCFWQTTHDSRLRVYAAVWFLIMLWLFTEPPLRWAAAIEAEHLVYLPASHCSSLAVNTEKVTDGKIFPPTNVFPEFRLTW